jgi:peptidoglycan/LPS O-acetylase OafA/YrhL
LDVHHRINIVGILWIILGVLLMLFGIALALFMLGLLVSGEIFLIPTSGDPHAGGLFIARCMAVIALCCFAMGMIAVVAGPALRRRRPWARIAIIVLSVINLINFPIGTGIGLYSLVVLLWPAPEKGEPAER